MRAGLELSMNARALCFSFFLTLSFAAAADWRDELNKAWQTFNQQPAAQAALSDSDILRGLKEALAQGTTRAISSLGRSDGFWGNALVRVPLPDAVGRVEKTLRRFGAGARVDQFHLTLNRAAEQAVPQVAGLFGNAVRAMSIQDVRGILGGEPDAATQFFRRTTSDSIRAKFLPIVQGVTGRVGVTQQYKSLTASYGPVMKLAGVQPVELDGYVTQKAMDGLFTTIGQEEAKIRQDPAARTSEILRKVFGAKGQ